MSEKKKTTENNKIEVLYVSENMVEDAAMDQALKKGVQRGADEIEADLRNDPTLPNLDENPEEKQDLLNDIIWNLRKKGSWEEENPEDKLSEKDKKALELGRKLLEEQEKKEEQEETDEQDETEDNGTGAVPEPAQAENTDKSCKGKLKRCAVKGVVGAAVVTVGVFALSMSSEANRIRMISVWNSIVGQELWIKINNDENRLRDNIEIEEASYDIKEKTGISVVKFLYVPNGMEFENYLLSPNLGTASMFYRYEGEIITVYMYKNNKDISSMQQIDGEVVKQIEIDIDGIKANISEIQNPDGQNTFSAQFERDNVDYSIWGKIDADMFERMVKGIAF